MSKPFSKDLFTLIKSLSKNEKGYIMKFAFTHIDGEAKFIRLFKAIANQKEYDETSLLKSEQYIRQFPRMKIYLYERILDSLDNYYAKENITIHLRKLLNRVVILFEKGMYEACIRQLHKIKTLSQRYELFTYLLETLNWERTLMIETQVLSNYEKLNEEEHDALLKQENLLWYSHAYDQVSLLYSETILIRSQKEDRAFKKLLPDSHFENEDAPLSLRAKILLLKSKAKYLSAIDDRKQYMSVARRCVKLMEQDPVFINQNFLQYLKILNNLIVTLSENKKFDEYESAITKLSELPLHFRTAQSDRMKSIIHMRVVIRKFYHHTFHKEFDEAKNLVHEFENCLDNYKHLISTTHRQFFLYALSYIHFIHGEYKQSLIWINQILNQSVSNEVKVFYGYAKILNILIHFELNNHDLLESLIPSTLRFLNNKTASYNLEKTFIQFLQDKILNVNSEKEKNQELKEFLLSIKKDFDPMEYKVMQYFDLFSWVESKINSIPFIRQLSKAKDYSW